MMVIRVRVVALGQKGKALNVLKGKRLRIPNGLDVRKGRRTS